MNAAQPDVPDWWRSYAAEFPSWHVWKGIAGLCYASRRMTSPPVTLRAEDPVDLRDQIKRWLGQRPNGEHLA